MFIVSFCKLLRFLGFFDRNKQIFVGRLICKKWCFVVRLCRGTPTRTLKHPFVVKRRQVTCLHIFLIASSMHLQYSTNNAEVLNTLNERSIYSAEETNKMHAIIIITRQKKGSFLTTAVQLVINHLINLTCWIEFKIVC